MLQNHFTMTYLPILENESQPQNIEATGPSSITDRLPLSTPTEIILAWYDQQSDGDIKIDFTKSIAHFHPDPAIRLESTPEKKIEKFREFLSLPEKQRSEIMSRSLSIVGHINLILQARSLNDKNAKPLEVKWQEWAMQWNNLLASALSNMRMYDWYFSSRPL